MRDEAESDFKVDLTPEQLAGRILSVYCRDFVSYNEITFSPTMYLNVLTGPNGSGKSTIVSAIILGLGGEPAVLDRSAHIADYVKSGERKATIVVTVHGRRTDSKVSFQRVINRKGESVYTLNNEQVTKKKFLEQVASFNIQVQNLCQFLPQDRVQDFAKMNPQELLLNTMSSICDSDLINSFTDLKDLRKEQLSSHASCNKDIENLDREQKRLDKLETTIAQYNEREELVKNLNIYIGKKKWLEVQKGQKKIDTCNNDLQAALKNLTVVKKKYDQGKRAQDTVIKMTSKLRNDTLQKTTELMQEIEKKTGLEYQVDCLKQKILQSKNILERNTENSIKCISDIAKAEERMKAHNADLQDYDAVKQQLNTKLQEKKQQIQKITDRMMQKYNERRALERKLNEEQIPGIAALKSRLNKFENLKAKKINELSNSNPNLIKAMNIVREMQPTLNAKVYDPILFEITADNDVAAMYLEHVIRFRDLLAFACENKSDMSTLIQKVCVENKLRVNFIYCEPTEKRHHSPYVPLKDLRAYGFTAYLSDLMHGPPTIINKLCQTYSIHNIPIGGEEITNYTSKIPKTIRLYFAGNKRFNVTVSKYRSQVMLTEVHVQARGTLMTVSSKEMESLQKSLTEAIRQKDKSKNALGESDSEFDQIRAISKENKDELAAIEKKLAYFKSVESEAAKREQELKDLRKSFVPIEELRNKYRSEVSTFARNIMELDRIIQIQSQTITRLFFEKALATLKESIHKSEHELQTELINESETELRDCTTAINRLKGLIQIQSDELSRKAMEVKRVFNGMIPTDANFPHRAEFEEENDVEVVNEKIHECQARIECLGDVDSEAIANYQRRKQEVDNLKQIVQRKAGQGKNIENKIQEIYNNWERKLNALIETISNKFSEFMESISYVGEVVLCKKDKVS
ncbi:structural maintenance of chromosomes protein 5 isoform X2 [Scaptodrosophila lebanonensis]|uniref:Structural maintenance of chromosomes protein 5 n=1 Tax=Drosophila lebanonensis TaxID=7225 RepID=A0A6J2TJQ7_DROLE|nr:structural maintenance of chromosomes protein 5 isoform X2 [Scaptodrosophila lebanonensis]